MMFLNYFLAETQRAQRDMDCLLSKQAHYGPWSMDYRPLTKQEHLPSN